ncbi:MAG: flagellar biosynthesis protein FlhB [candidate division Zixibacteria bacterium]|nr:flagellar biosynthesis protein FlhB [candidate division Zixibacteria bacterium]
MADESFQEKTEQPTPKRLKEAREKGQVARSTELSSIAIMFTGLLGVMALGSLMTASSREMFTWLFANSAHFSITADSAPALLGQVGWISVKIVGPMIILLVVVALGVSYVQVGSLFSTQALEPKFEKLNIIKGMKNLVSMKSVFTAVRDLIKLTIIAVIAFYAIRAEVPLMAAFTDMSTGEIGKSMVAIAVRVSFKILLALAVIAILDYAYQKWDYIKGLKMSIQDIKEELKHTEGNPLIKGRIRAIQRDQARKRMMQEVPKADVVITNPTHIAVALKYDTAAMDAPTVIAKGERLIAEAIKKIAAEAGVPIIENKPLARTLFKTVEIGMQIPADLYKAVAEILAYVYSLKGKSRR